MINAINRDDSALADGLEDVGMRIRRERQKSRELRRPARTGKTAEPEPVPESVEA